jgi:hypothetical protein
MASTVGTGTPPGAARSESRAASNAERRDGLGWVTFAGTMIALVGILNLIYGVAAIGDSRFFTQNVTYVISSLNTWGWVLAIIGAVQLASAFGIWAQASGARWVGIVTAALNAITQMIFIPAFPLLSLAIFAVDILVIYGLLAHGREPAIR